jgi:hypothetical protein
MPANVSMASSSTSGFHGVDSMVRHPTAEASQVNFREGDPTIQTLYPKGGFIDRFNYGPQPVQKGPYEGSGRTQIIFRNNSAMCRKFKTEKDTEMLNAPVKVYPDFCCPLFSTTLITHSGPVIRILNNGIPNCPSEVYAFRLTYFHLNEISYFLYHNKGHIKAWAIDKITKAARENGHNMAEHPKLTMDDWAIRFTVSTITPRLRSSLGGHDAGLWVLNFPNLLDPLRAIDYEDGSYDEFNILNLTCSLITPSQRLHVPEGGWGTTTNQPSRRDEGPAEKRSRPNFGPRQQQPTAVQLAQWGAEFATQKAKEQTSEIEELKHTVESLKQAQNQSQMAHHSLEPAYPELPRGQARPGGVTPWPCQGDDAPSLFFA